MDTNDFSWCVKQIRGKNIDKAAEAVVKYMEETGMKYIYRAMRDDEDVFIFMYFDDVDYTHHKQIGVILENMGAVWI